VLGLFQGVALTWLLYQLCGGMFRVSKTVRSVCPEGRPLLFGMSAVMQVLLLVLLCCQLIFFVVNAFGQRSAEDSTVGLVCVLLVVIPGSWLLRRVLWSSGTVVLVLGGIFLSAGAVFAASELRDELAVRPGAETLRCLRAGELLADQGWSGLRLLSGSVSVEEVRRAVIFSWPAVKLFGPGVLSIQAFGGVLQGCCGLMFLWLAARVGGIRAAVGGLFLLVLAEPEFRLLGVSGSPRIAGCFWMLALWVLTEQLRVWLSRVVGMRSGTGGMKAGLCVVVWLTCGLMLGVLAALLELSTSRGLLAALGLIPALLILSIGGGLGASGWGWRCWMGKLSGLCVSILVGCLAVTAVDRQIRSHLPAAGEIRRDALAELAAVESGTEGGERSNSVWREQYFACVPEADRAELNWRKIWHEKLGAGAALFETMLRKAFVYSRSAHVFDVDADRPAVGYPGLRSVLRYGFAAWIVLLAMQRLWNSEGEPQSPAEVFPICVVMTMLGGLLVFGEARAEDSLIWLFPLCWSAGQVLVRRRLADDSVSFGLPRHIFPGAVILSAVILLHAVLGLLVDGSGRTFARLAAVEPAVEDLSAESAVEMDRVSVRVGFPVGQRILPAGRRAVHEVRVLNEGGVLSSLRFFLSGGQRTSPSEVFDWSGLPLRYAVYFNDRLWRSGPISELGRVGYHEVRADFWRVPGDEPGNFVFVRLELECLADVSTNLGLLRPAIAIEYPWPGGIEQSGSVRPALSAAQDSL
jgi:hypothetical protein